MTVVKFGPVKKDAFEKAKQDQGDFVLPPKGYYVVQLKSCTSGFSKDDAGKEDKTRPRLENVWEIIGEGRENAPVQANYGSLWDYVSFSPDSEWKRAEFLLVTGKSNGDGDFKGGNLKTEEVVGTKALCRVSHEAGRNPGDDKRARVAKLMPWLDSGDEDAFGEEETEEETEDEELLTEEELLAMPPKELGAIAKEFEIDTSPFVKTVRGKKVPDIKGLVAAILEAQEGEPEEGEDSTDDDDPF